MELGQEQDYPLLMRLTKEQLSSVLALRENRDFQVFINVVAQDIEEKTKQLVCNDLDRDALLRLQGQTRYGVALLDTVVTAQQEYEKFSQPRS